MTPYALELVTPPAEEPVTLAEAKLHCRVEIDADDAVISGMIVAARELCESHVSRAFITQGFEATFTGWPGSIRLPRPPLISVEEVRYLDGTGTPQVLDPALYRVRPRGKGPGVILRSYGACWPSLRCEADNVTVAYTAGYGDAADVPETVKLAMKLLIGHWYENRETVLVGTVSKELEFTVGALLASEEWGALG